MGGGDNGIILKPQTAAAVGFNKIGQAGNKLGAVQFHKREYGLGGRLCSNNAEDNKWRRKLVTTVDRAGMLPWSFNFVDENYGWIVCEFGIILHTTNGG
ncbi:MAG: hypothetical protein IPG99_19330 [Ignavibacteria bacterium]|nr:hypothetical protein [Ignavibacteria bacterium]